MNGAHLIGSAIVYTEGLWSRSHLSDFILLVILTNHRDIPDLGINAQGQKSHSQNGKALKTKGLIWILETFEPSLFPIWNKEP